jgi:GTP-binding protein Era
LDDACNPGTAGFRSGLVALAGRANVGKSTLVNAMVGTKVSIVSDKPQTTRGPARAVLSTERAQVVLVDTPGLHKPRSLLGQRLNRTAIGALEGVEVVVMVVDGKAGVGGGDRFVAGLLGQRHVCVVNKIDGMRRAAVLAQLQAVAGWGFDEYFAVSARSGTGVSDLLGALVRRLPEGPPLYPVDRGRDAGTAGLGPSGPRVATPGRGVVIRDMGEPAWVAELVREQLLALAHDELPYSIACRVTEWDWPYVRCEILVERESQKGIVIGRAGSVLGRVGAAVRAQLPPGTYLDLSVRVARDWQREPKMLGRLGL